MIRTPIVQSVALCRGRLAARPLLVLLSRRVINVARPNSTSALQSKGPVEPSQHGAEGLHRQDASPPQDLALTKPDAVSTVPSKIKGDWVLFHPVYTPEELKAVEVINLRAKTLSDKFAALLVRVMRTCFDIASGYKHKDVPPASTLTVEELRKQNYLMGPDQWLQRAIFLETIAAVPGMVAASIRHLNSLRLMRRDSGWIHTLLEEAENERMHLMTFMALRRPGLWFRTLVMGAQGVFYNVFFLSYLFAPKVCHRFVGYLEEEAVLTYTRCIQDIEAGRLPEWADMPAPSIAIDYWRLPQDSKLLDVIYAIRSDETNHRFVNHTLANLNHKTDVNPFAFREPDMTVKGRKIAFERVEAEKYVQESHALLEEGRHQSESK
ncbi:alternative oxidase [Punctularia strigosozonata HHB-11173 SS5]|uniref:alternative oxidase n=1 Tax=Punctularia strigosozonata (strain HHB-11173) TaxID=741275 RepID=UPI0004418157|nr:alternative oxidase [Punctularia strigosozonata HHB-11173 SS5]EIN12586.1 alternative oxidase [Punctularia strigosozonata HHB-11173 SS5]